MKYVSAV